MEHYRQHVAGLFTGLVEAESARLGLIARGLATNRLLLLEAGMSPRDASPGAPDAGSAGRAILVAETRNARETAFAHQVMRMAAGNVGELVPT